MNQVDIMKRLTRGLAYLRKERDAWCAQVVLTGECFCGGKLDGYETADAFLRDHLKCVDETTMEWLESQLDWEEPTGQQGKEQ